MIGSSIILLFKEMVKYNYMLLKMLLGSQMRRFSGMRFEDWFAQVPQVTYTRPKGL